MATMAEVGLCDVSPAYALLRRTVPDEFFADEVRAALVLTRRAAVWTHAGSDTLLRPWPHDAKPVTQRIQLPHPTRGTPVQINQY